MGSKEEKATMALSLGGLTSGLTGGRRRVSSCVRTKVLESARWRHLPLSGLSDMTRRGVKINTESLDSGQSGRKDKKHIVVSHLAVCCEEVLYAWKGAVMRSLGGV